VKPSTVKAKLVLVAIAYAAVLLFAAVEMFSRYAYEASHPAEVSASSGMFAGGDMLLEIFIAFLFMIPTFFLIRIGAHFETPYTAWSKLLLTLGLSAPLCLVLVFLGAAPGTLTALCLERLLWSPFVLLMILISRFSARFDRAKRVISYALLSEGLTFCGSIAWVSLYLTHPN